MALPFDVPEFITILRQIRDVIYPSIVGYLGSVANGNVPALNRVKEQSLILGNVVQNDTVNLYTSETDIKTASIELISSTPVGECNSHILISGGNVSFDCTYPASVLTVTATATTIDVQYIGATSGSLDITAFLDVVKVT